MHKDASESSDFPPSPLSAPRRSGVVPRKEPLARDVQQLGIGLQKAAQPAGASQLHAPQLFGAPMVHGAAADEAQVHSEAPVAPRAVHAEVGATGHGGPVGLEAAIDADPAGLRATSLGRFAT